MFYKDIYHYCSIVLMSYYFWFVTDLCMLLFLVFVLYHVCLSVYLLCVLTYKRYIMINY